MNTRRRLLTVGLQAGLTLATAGRLPNAAAQTPPSDPLPMQRLQKWLPTPRLMGQQRFTYWGFSVYDASLWAQSDFDIARFWQQPLALELQYGRALQGAQIADRSLEEMQRGAEITTAQQRIWLAAMQRCFPDVVEGDRMTGVQLPGAAARFFVNGAFVGEVRDAEFARLFFGIWLAPSTSEPQLRAALLAGARGGS